MREERGIRLEMNKQITSPLKWPRPLYAPQPMIINTSYITAKQPSTSTTPTVEHTAWKSCRESTLQQLVMSQMKGFKIIPKVPRQLSRASSGAANIIIQQRPAGDEVSSLAKSRDHIVGVREADIVADCNGCTWPILCILSLTSSDCLGLSAAGVDFLLLELVEGSSYSTAQGWDWREDRGR